MKVITATALFLTFVALLCFLVSKIHYEYVSRLKDGSILGHMKYTMNVKGNLSMMITWDHLPQGVPETYDGFNCVQYDELNFNCTGLSADETLWMNNGIITLSSNHQQIVYTKRYYFSF